MHLAAAAMSLIVSLCVFLFPRDVLDEIWDLIETVSENFPTYSWYCGGADQEERTGTLCKRQLMDLLIYIHKC